MARKMILVDPIEFSASQKRTPTLDGLSETIDKENNILKSILSDNTIDDRTKSQKYQQAFQRMLTHSRMYRQKPIGRIEMEEAEANLGTGLNNLKSFADVRRDLLKTIPDYLKPKANSLLNAISSIPNVHFDSSNQLVIRNEPIHGSDFITLFDDLLHRRKSTEPIGWRQLSNEMVNNQLPMELIINPTRRNTIRSEKERGRPIKNNTQEPRSRKTSKSISKWERPRR